MMDRAPGKDPPHRSSIFQLFKQRWGGPKSVQFPVSAYGKLPVYRDFIRNGLAGPEAQSFKQWLDQGFSHHWATRPEYRECSPAPHGFLLHFPRTHHFLLGYLWGSADYGQLRSFPFALFVAQPAGRGAGSLLVALEGLAQVLEQARALRRQLEEAADLQRVYQLLRTAVFQVSLPGEDALRRRLAERLGGLTVAEFAGSLFGETAAAAWPALVARLRADAAGSEPWALRLPASPLLPALCQLELWVALLAASRRASLPRSLFFGDEGAAEGLVLIARDVTAEDFLAFHPRMPEYEAIRDLRPAPPKDSAETATGPSESAGPPESPGDVAGGRLPLSSLLQSSA